MLLFKRGLGLVGHFEKLPVKPLKLAEHPVGRNPNAVLSIARADQSESELFQVHACACLPAPDLLSVLVGKIIEVVNQVSDAGNRHLDFGTGFHRASTDRGATADQVTGNQGLVL